MDRRTLLAVFLSVGIYYTWLMVRGPAPIPEEDLVVEPAPTEAPAPVVVDNPGSSDAPIRDLPFNKCGLEGRITTDGGALHSLYLPAHEGPYPITPLYSYVLGLFTGGSSSWDPYGEAPVERLLSDEARALHAGVGNPASNVRYEVVEQSEDRIVLSGVSAQGVQIQQTWIEGTGDPCTFTLDVSWTASSAVSEAVWIGLHDTVKAPGGMFDYYVNTTRMFAHVDDDLWYGAWTEPENGELHEPELVDEESETTEWVAIADRYFGMIVAPENKLGSAAWSMIGEGEDVRRGVLWLAADELAAGQTVNASFQVYVGPLDTDTLAKVDESFVDIIDFGMFALFAYPLLYLLRWLQGYIGNWGLSIIVLTVMVKGAFFPLTQAAFKSGEAMKAIQPKLNEIRETYKDNQEELNKRTMELFRENKVNPLGGCLPMLVQMPVFLALFYVLMYSADLYHTEFLYLRDLSSPDPYCALPVIVVGLMLIQQQFTPTGNMDPAQARMIKFMPLMFGMFWFLFPSGLVVYYFVNTVLSVLQQWWIRRTFSTASPPDAAT